LSLCLDSRLLVRGLYNLKQARSQVDPDLLGLTPSLLTVDRDSNWFLVLSNLFPVDSNSDQTAGLMLVLASISFEEDILFLRNSVLIYARLFKD